MQKKIVSLTLALLMVLSLSVSALAITPRWVTTDSCDVWLGFSGTTANCNVIIDGKSGTNKIVATVYLQKYVNGSYTTVTTWGGTSYSDTYMLDDTANNCVKGTSYRLLVSATVYNVSGVSETVSNYSTATC